MTDIARIYRFREDAEFKRLYPGSPNLVSVYIKDDNILVINRDLFEQLRPEDQSQVYRAEAQYQWLSVDAIPDTAAA